MYRLAFRGYSFGLQRAIRLGSKELIAHFADELEFFRQIGVLVHHARGARVKFGFGPGIYGSRRGWQLDTATLPTLSVVSEKMLRVE